MMKLFVSMQSKGNTFLPDAVKAYLEERFDVEYASEYDLLFGDAFKEKIKNIDIILTGWGHPMITYDMIKDSRVKIIAHTGGSVGSLVDLSLFDHGIKVLSGNVLYAESVAEGTLAYILSGLRKIPYYVEDVRKGGWRGDGFSSEGLFERTVGIVGLGTISRCLIKMLRPFRVKLKIYDFYQIEEQFLAEHNAVQVESLDEIFLASDIVTVHMAMNEKTRGIIGKGHFDLLHDGALFVNTARGAIIREDEMIEALAENRFKAVLDVYCTEPLDAESPLRKLENVYCIPHMGGPTLDRRPMITIRLADEILRVANNEKSELEISKETAERMTVGG